MLATVALRAAWLARFPVAPLAPVDAEGFHLLARNLLAGNGFALAWDPPFCPDTLRPPLYPLFIALGYRLLGADPARSVLLQVLLEGLTTALAAQLGQRAAGPRTGALAAWLYALNGSTQRYTGYLFAEALLLPALAGALCATLAALRRPSTGRAAWAGVGWGLALLIKPNAQYLALAVGGLLALASVKRQASSGKGGLRRLTFDVLPAALFFATLGLTLCPWLVRNHVVLGRWTLSTAFEENVVRVSAVATLAELEGTPAEPWTATWEALYQRLVTQTARAQGWANPEPAALSCAEWETRRAMIAETARALIRAHPWAFIRAHWRGVARSLRDVGERTWYPALTGRDWESTGRIADIGARMGESLRIGAVGDALHALWLERVLFPPPEAAALWWGLLAGRIAVVALAARGLARLRWPVALALGGTVAYFILLPGPIAYDRFYLPAIPAVVTLLAGALSPPLPGYNSRECGEL